MKRIIAASALLLLGVGCAAPRVMVSQELIGGRSAKYAFQKTGSAGSGKDATKLYDFSVRLCDFDNSGKETNCKDTLLMTNVSYHPLHFH